ncbi:DUF3667 domain-containing protein [Phenylobacterium sp.]|uniref:DUF3667 domain-containing protein n=1 Tax=Phenylobacterium sp. TaxID=1871053 RepID=UPI0035672849
MATGDNLLEAVTADTIATEAKRAAKYSLPIGAPCPNCKTTLAGAWCYNCGQRGEEYHRSIWRLAWEAIEGLVDLDGRIWQTFPRLILRPGKLTRDYLDGHRAVQVPPFRLFLIVLVLVFFAGGLEMSQNRQNFQLATLNSPEVQKQLTPKDKADLNQGLKTMREKLAQGAGKSESPSSAWLRQRLVHAMDNKDAFKAAIQEWAQRFAILMLPIAALMLSVLFVFKRGIYVFDHLIFAMHSLSFQGLLLTAVFLGSLGAGWAANLLWIAPVHLFVHMRGAYKISVIGTLLRMLILFLGSSVAFGILVAGLVLVGIATA